MGSESSGCRLADAVDNYGAFVVPKNEGSILRVSGTEGTYINGNIIRGKEGSVRTGK